MYSSNSALSVLKGKMISVYESCMVLRTSSRLLYFLPGSGGEEGDVMLEAGLCVPVGAPC